jgi:hypothetical protein
MKKLTFDDTKMEMVMAWLGLAWLGLAWLGVVALWRCSVVDLKAVNSQVNSQLRFFSNTYSPNS